MENRWTNKPQTPDSVFNLGEASSYQGLQGLHVSGWQLEHVVYNLMLVSTVVRETVRTWVACMVAGVFKEET